MLTPEALAAFEELKMRCMTAPVLAFANFEKPFRLETDASKEGLGAVLLQEASDGQFHPVAFASRELKGGEPKYHTSNLEFLALKLAMTEQFREYLQYQPFTVRTDNNLLTYILDHTEFGHIRPSLGSCSGQIQYEVGVLKGLQQQGC